MGEVPAHHGGGAGRPGHWPWLPGTIVQQCGPDEFQIVVEDMSVALRQDGSRPTPRTPKNKLFYPLAYQRQLNEIRLRDAR